MPIKISRDITLIKFRKLPLLEYDDINDTDIFYYPESHSFHWIKIEKPTSKKLTIEFKKLIQLLEIEALIVFGQINKPWLSKHTRKRRDFKALTKSLKYFKSIHIGKNFNGAIKLNINEFDAFISNFYTLTLADGGFSDYYIGDLDENILFHIHYSGEVKVLSLNRDMQEKLSSNIAKTKFIDALREGTDRV